MAKPNHNTSHAWAESRDRFPADTILRKHGFVIHRRPEKGSTLWRLGSEVMTEEEALTLIADAVAEGAGTATMRLDG